MRSGASNCRSPRLEGRLRRCPLPGTSAFFFFFCSFFLLRLFGLPFPLHSLPPSVPQTFPSIQIPLQSRLRYATWLPIFFVLAGRCPCRLFLTFLLPVHSTSFVRLLLSYAVVMCALMPLISRLLKSFPRVALRYSGGVGIVFFFFSFFQSYIWLASVTLGPFF